MKAAPRLHGGWPARAVGLFAGLVTIGAAIVLLLESRLGLAPWDVFHQGIARHTPLRIGSASIVVGFLVVAVSWVLGQAPGLGTVANAIVIGASVDILLALGIADGLSDGGLVLRIGLVAAGLGLFGLGSAFYIGAGFGAGPRDSLMLAGSRRTGVRIAVVRLTMEVVVVALGIALGGVAGIGTIAHALLVGPVVEASFWLLVRLGMAERAEAERTP